MTNPWGFGDPQEKQEKQVVPATPIWDDAATVLYDFLRSAGPTRGGYQIDPNARTQQLPGVSVPVLLIQAMNMLSGHPLLPYGYDRAALHRDLLYMAISAYARVLVEQEDQAPAGPFIEHIAAMEKVFRSELFIEEMNMRFVEDLAVAAGSLELRMKIGSHEAVYDQLKKVFDFVGGVQDSFWRPLLLQFLWNIPEIRDGLAFLKEEFQYALDDQVIAWDHMIQNARESSPAWTLYTDLEDDPDDSLDS
jgi:hypothetical protein